MPSVTGQQLTELATNVLTRVIQKYRDAGIEVGPALDDPNEGNTHKRVSFGPDNWERAIDLFAAELIRCRVTRFADLPVLNYPNTLIQRVASDKISIRVYIFDGAFVADVCGRME